MSVLPMCRNVTGGPAVHELNKTVKITFDRVDSSSKPAFKVPEKRKGEDEDKDSTDSKRISLRRGDRSAELVWFHLGKRLESTQIQTFEEKSDDEHSYCSDAEPIFEFLDY